MNDAIDRIQLQPNYSISRVIKGGWHLAGGHGAVDEQQAIEDMRRFVQAGITTFDCADIYTGVEELIGKFIKRYTAAFSCKDLAPIQIHTKYVPDNDALATLTKTDTEKIIDRSLLRLGVDRLDLVQFAWWNNDIPGYVETAVNLSELQRAGKIRHLGVTNFAAQELIEILDAGVKVVSNQVQYSVLDHRPEHEMLSLCEAYGITLLCYGVVAGGFLSDRFLAAPDPMQPLENRSLVKYRLIIEEFGGYSVFQKVLQLLHQIADKYGVGIAEVATKYILQKPQVAAVIIGARNLDHLDRLKSLAHFTLDQDDLKILKDMVADAKGPSGPVYGLERDKDGVHGQIMRYNLNAQRD